jgi:hypothetical protein
VSRMFSTALCLVCGTAVLLAGCGSSSQTASSTLARSTASTAAVASSTDSGIGGRVLKNNELAGFTSAGVALYLSTQKWLSNPNDQQSAAQAAAEKAMLTRNGFRGGAVENLTGPAPDGGLSIVEQFRTAAAARAALAFYVSQEKKSQVQSTAGKFVAFKVPRIPGAVGYTLGGASGGANISFTQGDYYLLVGRQGGSPADIAGLNGAARHLYDRVAE